MDTVCCLNKNIKGLNSIMQLMPNLQDKLICCDVDNTIANINDQLASEGYSISEYPCPNLDNDFWTTVKGLNMLKSAKKIVKTCELLNTFKKYGASIIFATSREPKMKHITEKWLYEHNIRNWQIYYTSSKHLLNADIYIEDDPYQISKILSSGKIAIIPEWEYNKGISSDTAIYFNIM